MDDRTPIDELRALLSGSLSSEEADRMRERCAADPELRAFLDEIAEVQALTAPVADEPPLCRLTFEEVEGALVPQRVRRKVLRWTLRVAAAVLVLVGGAITVNTAFFDREDRPGEDRAVEPALDVATARSPGGEAGRSLVLRVIPLDTASAPEAGPEIPEALADYRPVQEGRIQWVQSFDEAKAMARACSRPVLLFLHIPGCGWCKKLRDGTLAHCDVLSRMNDFVPVQVNLMKAPKELRALVATWDDWPWLGAMDADGGVILSFPGVQGPGDFSGHLKEAAALAGPAVITWEKVNEAAAVLNRGRWAEEAGSMGEAYQAYREILADDAAAPLHEAARRGVRRVAFASRDALLAIEGLADAKTHPDTLESALRTAIEQFENTPYAEDLEAVRDHLAKHGTFPTLSR